MSDEYGRIFEEQDDATELAEDEKEGLIPSYISTRGELNQAEQQNIVQGELWAFAKKRNPLDMAFLDTLHKKMYGAVWEWAGSYRKTARNIGIDAYRIPMELKQLIEDTHISLIIRLTSLMNWPRGFITGLFIFIPIQMAMDGIAVWPQIFCFIIWGKIDSLGEQGILQKRVMFAHDISLP